MLPSILALIEAGTVKETDDTLAMIQNITREQGHAITKWLALTTNTPAYCRFMQIGADREEHIRYTPEQVRAEARKAGGQ